MLVERVPHMKSDKFNMQQFQYVTLFAVLCCICSNASAATNTTLQTYIVHIEPGLDSASFMPADTAGAAEPQLIYSYRSVANGFAARLTEQQVVDMSMRPGFLHAYPDRIVPLLTTHTPRFLGLRRSSAGFWNESRFGRGVIIGILDTGVSPDLPSFRDGGRIPAPPGKWKGACEFGPSVCNNKLIGARNFVKGMQAMRRGSAGMQALPIDNEGHGTHTASTAGGAFIDGANVEGHANGTAAGIAPYAHLAIYKVCDERGCADSDILAGMDSAAADGVDVMSLSLGGLSQPFHSDSIAIGAFGAAERGVFVSCAGGNLGPSKGTLSNEAPWILTVGASTVDRAIRTTVSLGNGERFDGQSVHQPKGGAPSPALPLVFPGARSSDAAICARRSLDLINVKGKAVVCDVGMTSRVEKGMVVKEAGGAAMIVTNLREQGFVVFADVHVLPASHVSYAAGLKIKSYINSTSAAHANASISFKGTILGKLLTPVVAYFSSRGPSVADPNILKPDIIGPGVNILAAWPFGMGTPKTKFNIISGTSMATPHLSGVATLLKSAHPDWSPSVIKSAIMTTAYATANDGSPIPDETYSPANLFTMGAGHVNPSAANSPGLVYNITTEDYIAYLCGLRYTDSQVSAIARRRVKCSDIVPVSGAELNYPSFMVFLQHGKSVRVTRTVTNVGVAGSTYEVRIKRPSNVSVTVKPKTLTFSRTNEKKRYTVTFGVKESGGGYSGGHLTWISSDNRVRVKSPIMVAIDGSTRQSM